MARFETLSEIEKNPTYYAKLHKERRQGSSLRAQLFRAKDTHLNLSLGAVKQAMLACSRSIRHEDGYTELNTQLLAVQTADELDLAEYWRISLQLAEYEPLDLARVQRGYVVLKVILAVLDENPEGYEAFCLGMLALPLLKQELTALIASWGGLH